MNYDPELVSTVQQVIEFLGTFAFAISGIRHAAACRFDWFGGFVCGVCVAIGGGTIRDVMLGVTPFWMTSPFYIVCTALAQVFVILFARSLKRLDNAWFVFDTLGLGLFTIAGLQKTIDCGHAMWVAILMGCVTGSAGGVIRDIFLNRMPLIFRKEIYAMASIAGGILYWVLIEMNVGIGLASVIAFLFICLVRALAMKFHISLPQLRNIDDP
ncbi:MAG: trimeric intracellular cation channel family protein [Prevotella sp.]|nr:trimeric intracellular cation channel family protein [Prevotella sp.]